MKRQIILILFTCWFATAGNAQDRYAVNDTTPVFHLDSISSEFYELTKFIRVFEDSGRTLDIREVSSSSFFPRFNENKFTRSFFDDQSIVGWAHFRIVNNTGATQRLIISERFTAFRIQYYRRLDMARFEEASSGPLIPVSQRASIFGFVTTLEKNDTGIFYVRFENDNFYGISPKVNLRVYTSPALEKYQQQVRQSWWFNGIYSGISFLMAVYALALFIIFRERAYIWLLLTQLVNMCYFLHFTQVSFYFLLPEHVLLNRYANMFLASFIVLFNFCFIASYLDFRKYFPRLFYWILLLVFIQSIVGPVSYFAFDKFYIGAPLSNYLIIPIVLISFSMMLYQAVKLRMRTAKIMVWADVAMFAAVIFSLLVINNVIDLPRVYIVTVMQAGFIMQMLIWTAAIVNRVVLLRKEKDLSQERELLLAHQKEELIRDQKNILEQKVEERTEELKTEKKKSDDLLLNILPEETAHELKQIGHSIAKTHGMVTVMFTDFKDFTLISEKITPELLVEEIDQCFRSFDHIMEKHRIEKIKTIGDSYMCAGGLPTPTSTHAEDTIRAAIDIRDFIEERKKIKIKNGEIPFEIRIGIHTGSVVAGVVGAKKFAYDIWGDTVNTASRMEQNSEAGKINISGATFELIRDKFKCIHRGKIDAKHKGMIDMYFVE